MSVPYAANLFFSILRKARTRGSRKSREMLNPPSWARGSEGSGAKERRRPKATPLLYGNGRIVGRLRGDPAPRRSGCPPVPRPVCGRFRPASDPGRWSCSAPSRRETRAIPPGSALPSADRRSGRSPLSSADPVQDLELFDSLFLPFPAVPAAGRAGCAGCAAFVPVSPDGLLAASWSALAAFLYDSLR